MTTAALAESFVCNLGWKTERNTIRCIYSVFVSLVNCTLNGNSKPSFGDSLTVRISRKGVSSLRWTFTTGMHGIHVVFGLLLFNCTLDSWHWMQCKKRGICSHRDHSWTYSTFLPYSEQWSPFAKKSTAHFVCLFNWFSDMLFVCCFGFHFGLKFRLSNCHLSPTAQSGCTCPCLCLLLEQQAKQHPVKMDEIWNTLSAAITEVAGASRTCFCWLKVMLR